MSYFNRYLLAIIFLFSTQSSHAAFTTYNYELDFLTALGSATIITESFDSLTAAAVINNGDTINGITYDYIPLPPDPALPAPVLMIDSEFDTTSGLNYLSTDDGLGLLGGDSLTLTFDQTLYAIGLYIISDVELFNGDVTLTTNNGQTVDNIAVPDLFLFDADAFYIGLIEDDFSQGFTSITLSSLDEGFFFTIDDITVAPVPLPAAFILFSLGLLSLGLSRRRSIH